MFVKLVMFVTDKYSHPITFRYTGACMQ